MVAEMESDSDFYSLMESIREHGVQSPCVAIQTEDGLQLIVGYRRWQAQELLHGGEGEMQVYVLPKNVSLGEINDIMFYEEGGHQKAWPDLNKWTHLYKNGAADVVEVAKKMGVTKKEAECRFAAIPLCQEFYEKFPKSPASCWSLFRKAIQYKRGNDRKLEDALNNDSALKAKVFEEVHNQNVRDASANKLNDVIFKPQAKDALLTEGFDAAVRRLTKKGDNPVKTLTVYLNNLNNFNLDKLQEAIKNNPKIAEEVRRAADKLQACLD